MKKLIVFVLFLLPFCLNAGVSIQSPVTQTSVEPNTGNLLFYWNMHEGDGTTIINSGFADTKPIALIDGATWINTSGRDFKVLYFDGTNDSISFTTEPAFYVSSSSSFCIMMWVKAWSDDKYSAIFEYRDVVDFTHGFHVLYKEDNKLYFQAYCDTQEVVYLNTEQNFKDGNWHHIACGGYGGSGYIYVDGELNTSNLIIAPCYLSSNHLTSIGTDERLLHLGQPNYAKMCIDEIRIYSEYDPANIKRQYLTDRVKFGQAIIKY